MTQAVAGPSLSPEEESDLQRGQRKVALAEAEKAVEVIEEKIAGMQQTLKTRRDEAAQLRAELEG
jgi:hypothetical protein